MQKKLLVLFIGASFSTGCTTADLSYNKSNEQALVLYEPINNVDIIIKSVDLGQAVSTGKHIALPAIHRINGKSLSGQIDSQKFGQPKGKIGYKIIPAGNYAITSAITGMYNEFKGEDAQGTFLEIFGNNNQSCRENHATVINVKPGRANFLPLSYFTRDDIATENGKENLNLERSRQILKAYPNITAELALVEFVTVVDFGKPTALGLIKDSCASAKTFKEIKQ